MWPEVPGVRVTWAANIVTVALPRDLVCAGLQVCIDTSPAYAADPTWGSGGGSHGSGSGGGGGANTSTMRITVHELHLIGGDPAASGAPAIELVDSAQLNQKVSSICFCSQFLHSSINIVGQSSELKCHFQKKYLKL